MAKYIDRQKAIDAIKRWDQQKLYLPIEFREMLEVIPTADVRPVVKGHWERAYGDSRFMCSVCKGKEAVPTIMGEPIVWECCPNCGADMRGEKDE